MFKLSKIAVAVVLGLMMSLSLLVSSTFAQSVKSHTMNKTAQVTVAASAIHSATQTSHVQLTGARWGGYGWGGGWGGGWCGW